MNKEQATQFAIQEANKYGKIEYLDVSTSIIYKDANTNQIIGGYHSIITVNVKTNKGRGTLAIEIETTEEHTSIKTQYSEIENYGKKLRDPRFVSPYSL